MTTTRLPTPADRPHAHVVIYDGECGFCRGQVARFARWDVFSCLSYMSLHDDAVYQRYSDLDREQLMQHMVIVDRHGRRHAGAASIRFLSWRLPFLWPLAPLLHLPGTLPLWSYLYGHVARRRYQISQRMGGATQCDSGTCDVKFRGN